MRHTWFDPDDNGWGAPPEPALRWTPGERLFVAFVVAIVLTPIAAFIAALAGAE